jgi:MFS transporter, DHA3 family, macrolide efflux protein
MRRADTSLSTLEFLTRRKNYSRLIAARFVSVFGDQAHTITNMWLVQQLTGSALAMATVFVANTIPRILFSLAGGVSVDRFDRKRILILSDLLRALCVSILGLLVLAERAQMWHIVTVSAFNGAVGAFFGPAVSAIVPAVVERDELQKANAVSGMSLRLASILGSAGGGLIVSAIGAGGAYLVDASTFLVSALVILAAAIPRLDRVRGVLPSGIAGVRRDLGEGLTYVFSQNALLRVVILATAVVLVAIPVAQLLPSFAENALSLTDARQVGFLWSAMTVGLFLGALFLSSVYEVPNQVLGVLVSALLFGGASLVLGLSSEFLVALTCIVLMGFSLSLVTVLSNALFQTLVPRDMLGRFFGNVGLVTLGLQPLVMWLAGFAADSSSAALVFGALGGLLLIFGSVWALQYQATIQDVRQQHAALARVESRERNGE